MISETAVVSKITRRLIPFMFLLYIVSYLDRINVGFAALQLNQALKFDPTVFGLGAGIFFIGYFIFEIPSNLIMQRVGARVWMARIMVTWGLLSSATMFVSGAVSFYVLRFLLGAAEAGFFPGMILYLTYWFPVEARGRAVARFMTATAMAGVVGGPISGFLLKMDGSAGLAGWQWLFLTEGLPAVILGVLVFVFLPNGPEAASWLSPEEKAWIISTVAEEREAQRLHGHSTLGEVLRSFRVWSLAFIYFAVVISFYGISLWLPQIVKSLSNISDLLVGFVAAIPFIAASVGMVIIGRSSDCRNERRWHVAGSAFVGTTGLVLAALLKSPVAEVAALSLAAVGIWGSLGPFWAMSSQFLTGTAAAAGIALINSIGNLGGFAGPYLIGVVRSHTNSFALAFFILAACPLIGGAVALCLNVPSLKKTEIHVLDIS